jgi:hypothetical protein
MASDLRRRRARKTRSPRLRFLSPFARRCRRLSSIPRSWTSSSSHRVQGRSLTDTLESNGAGETTICGGCAAYNLRLVVDHEVGRDVRARGVMMADAGKRLTLRQELGWRGPTLVHPRRALDRRLRSCQRLLRLETDEGGSWQHTRWRV